MALRPSKSEEVISMNPPILQRAPGLVSPALVVQEPKRAMVHAFGEREPARHGVKPVARSGKEGKKGFFSN